jgi:hypothetical protein
MDERELEQLIADDQVQPPWRAGRHPLDRGHRYFAHALATAHQRLLEQQQPDRRGDHEPLRCHCSGSSQATHRHRVDSFLRSEQIGEPPVLAQSAPGGGAEHLARYTLDGFLRRHA